LVQNVLDRTSFRAQCSLLTFNSLVLQINRSRHQTRNQNKLRYFPHVLKFCPKFCLSGRAFQASPHMLVTSGFHPRLKTTTTTQHEHGLKHSPEYSPLPIDLACHIISLNSKVIYHLAALSTSGRHDISRGTYLHLPPPTFRARLPPRIL
jgi:hypothetical protein